MSVDVPPKSGRRRMSYPLRSLSTVSLTKDMFPGWLTLQGSRRHGSVSADGPGGGVGTTASPLRPRTHHRHEQRGRERAKQARGPPHPLCAVRVEVWRLGLVISVGEMKPRSSSSPGETLLTPGFQPVLTGFTVHYIENLEDYSPTITCLYL